MRNRGTIGGSVANNDPAADYPAAVLALGATIVTDTRRSPPTQFFRGMFETALEPGEIITAVSFPMPSAAGYAKIQTPASRYALVGVFVASSPDKVRVAVTGAGPACFVSPRWKPRCENAFTPDAIAAIKVDTGRISPPISTRKRNTAPIS